MPCEIQLEAECCITRFAPSVVSEALNALMLIFLHYQTSSYNSWKEFGFHYFTFRSRFQLSIDNSSVTSTQLGSCCQSKITISVSRFLFIKVEPLLFEHHWAKSWSVWVWMAITATCVLVCSVMYPTEFWICQLKGNRNSSASFLKRWLQMALSLSSVCNTVVPTDVM